MRIRGLEPAMNLNDQLAPSHFELIGGQAGVDLIVESALLPPLPGVSAQQPS